MYNAIVTEKGTNSKMENYGDVELVSIDDIIEVETPERLPVPVEQTQVKPVAQQVKPTSSEITNPLGWGESKELLKAGQRLQAFMPGGKKLKVEDAAMVAQYASLMDANPFRGGEVYAYERGGQVTLIEGYQLLTRIAKRQSEYVTKYAPLTPEERVTHAVPDGAMAIKCTLLRDDRRHLIKEYKDMGATFQEAFDLVAESAIGMIASSENIAVVGWSRGQVAEKRALKNCIKRAFAIPSPAEVRAEAELMASQGHVIRDLEVKAARLEAGQQAAIAAPRTETLNERVNLLRGEVEEGIN